MRPTAVTIITPDHHRVGFNLYSTTTTTFYTSH